MYLVCRHIMPNGNKCDSPALRGKQFCYFHTRVHSRAPQKGQTADQPLEFPVLEDRCAIQLALAQVLNRLGSGKLDPRSAGLLLYGLQIASQNVERNLDILPKYGVEAQTRTKDGDVLAPPKVRCHKPENCGNCPHLAICEDFMFSKDVDELFSKRQQTDQPFEPKTLPQAVRRLLGLG
jgi:hypothetical protein